MITKLGLSLAIILVSSAPIFLVNGADPTVGNGCSADSDCTGPNERCVNVTWLDPGCSTGVCQCLPCYTTGDFSGYNTYTGDACALWSVLQLGDPCNGTYNEQMPGNSGCDSSTNVVACNDGFNASGDVCVVSGVCEGGACLVDGDCAGELLCVNSFCACSDSHDKYEASTGDCVKKSYGDSCTADTDCWVEGLNWKGFTYSSAECISNRCECGENNTLVLATYLENESGSAKNMNICIVANGTSNVANGGACTVDPIYYGDSADVAVCSSNQVCFSCPEDPSTMDGRCHTIVGNFPLPSASCTATTTAAAVTASSTTTSAISSAATAQGATTSTVDNATASTTSTAVGGSSANIESSSESTISTSTMTATATATMTTTTTVAAYLCGGTSCNGYGFVDSYSTSNPETRCLSANSQLLYCDTASDSWSPVVSESSLAYLPCVGNFTFSIVTGSYWLNGAVLLKLSGGTWQTVDTSLASSYFPAYLARLRPNEGSGSFYCYVEATDNSYLAYFYDGTSYYSLLTDESGNLVTQVQTVPQYAQYSFSPVVTLSEIGCDSPACIWFQETFNSSNADGALYYEIMYNGSLWYTWTNGAYQLYTGEFTSHMFNVMTYFDTFYWKISNGTRYHWIDGFLYQVASFGVPTSGPITGWDFANFVDSDPLATGGFYYSLTQTTGTIGMFKNLSGDYWCKINNGALIYQRLPPSCSWGADIFGNSNPSCTTTDDIYPLTSLIVCDPSQTSNICGNGYLCSKLPAVFGRTCTKGYCIPDLSSVCSATTTAASNSALKKYGSSCASGTECYTGICQSGVCSCSSCTKILVGFDWSWSKNSIVYNETCIPSSGSTVGGLGDPCNLWADVKQQYCSTGLVCSKCPEVWNTAVANATCTALTLPSTACPSEFECGYAATCIMVGGSPTCTCINGYNLEPNMKDCYGWNVTAPGSCSVTCGTGVVQVTRSCDKAADSTAVCDGNATVTSICATAVQCPLPAAVVSSSVLLTIQSRVITPPIFNTNIKAQISTVVASSLSNLCLNSSSVFENQCCPGRAWPPTTTTADCVNASSGVQFYSEYSDGQNFVCYIMAVPNPSSTCCTSANTKTARRRRSPVSTGIDQNVLASVVSSTTVLGSVTEAVQSVDPNAVVPSNAVTLATVLTTTATAATAGNTTVAAVAQSNAASSDDTIGGLHPWQLGVIVVAVVLAVAVAVTVPVVIIIKKKKSALQNKVQAASTSTFDAGPRPKIGMRARSPPAVDAAYAYGYGHQAYTPAPQPFRQPVPAASYPSYYGYYPPVGQQNPQDFAARPAPNYYGGGRRG